MAILRDNFSIFLLKNICCEYSLESPCRGYSNVYSQHMYVFMENCRKLFFNDHQIPSLSVLLSISRETDGYLKIIFHISPYQGNSNEYRQCMFLWRTVESYPLMPTVKIFWFAVYRLTHHFTANPVICLGHFCFYL